MGLLFSQHLFRLQYYVAVNQMNNLSYVGSDVDLSSASNDSFFDLYQQKQKQLANQQGFA